MSTNGKQGSHTATTSYGSARAGHATHTPYARRTSFISRERFESGFLCEARRFFSI